MKTFFNRWALSGITLLVLTVTLAVPGFCAPSLKLISHEPFPARNYRVYSNQATSGTLSLVFENIDCSPSSQNRSHSETFMIAGAQGHVPKITIKRLSFVHYIDGLPDRKNTQPEKSLSASIARISELGLFRQFDTYGLTISTAIPGPDNDVFMLQNMAIDIDLGPDPHPELSDSVKDFVYVDKQFPHSILLNPQIASGYTVLSSGKDWSKEKEWARKVTGASYLAPVFRFKIYKDGLYVLDPADLKKVSGGRALPAVSDWRVYRDGHEVPLVLSDNKKLILPVAYEGGILPGEKTYWLLTRESGLSKKPMRMSVPSNVQKAAGPPIDHASFEYVSRRIYDYHPKLKPEPNSTKWYSWSVGGGVTERGVITMPVAFHPDRCTTLTASFRYGFANFSDSPIFRVYINGREGGETTVTSQFGNVAIPLDFHLFHSGENEFAFQMVTPGPLPPQHDMLIQDITFNWSEPLSGMSIAGMPFTVSRVSTGPLTLGFASSLPPNALVIGQTETGLRLLAPDASRKAFSDSSFARYYTVEDVSAAKHPRKFDLVDGIRIFEDKSEPEYVAIAASSLTSATQPFVELHRAQGLSAQCVDAQAIYDAFTYGSRSTEAIKSFLRYMFERSSGRAPWYVFLVGEASDYQGDPSLLPEGSIPDMIPVNISKKVADAPPGDQAYAACIGNDQLADFLVGRLSATTPDQVTGYLKKIQGYMKAPVMEWGRRAEFVLDDNVEFTQVAQSILSEAMSPPIRTSLFKEADYEYVPNLRVLGHKRSWYATDALLNLFNSGVGIVNYFGHGGPNLWSHERLLHLSDLPHLHNDPRLPLVTCASCDNAWIDYPTAPVASSMGEILVRQPTGGAVALFGPVAGASPFEHSTLVERLMEGLSREGLRRTGDLTVYAKNHYYAETRSSSIPQQYLLIGDPAITLKIPQVTDKLNLKPVVMLSDSPMMIEAEAPWKPGTKTDFRLVDMNTGKEVTSSTVNTNKISVPAPPLDPGIYAVTATSEVGGNHDHPVRIASALLQVRSSKVAENPRAVEEKQEPDTSGTLSFASQSGVKFREGETPTLTFDFAPATTQTVQFDALVYQNGSVVGEARSLAAIRGTTTPVQVNLRQGLKSPATSLEVKIESLTTGTEKSKSLAFTTVTLPVIQPADITFVPGSAKIWTQSKIPIRGATVFGGAKIMNIGASTARNVMLQASVDSPTGSRAVTVNDLTMSEVGDLKPGETKDVVYRWENTDTPGSHTLFLVANGGKSVYEANYENNTIATPPIQLTQVGDMKAESLDVDPPWVVSGSSVTLTARFTDDSIVPRGPVTAEMGFLNPLSGETTNTRLIIDTMTSSLVEKRSFVMPEGFSRAFAVINSDHNMEELQLENNRVESPLISMVDFSRALPSLDINLASVLADTEAPNFELVSTGVLRTKQVLTSGTGQIISGKSLVLSGNTSDKMDAGDGLWTALPWLIALDGGEKASPAAILLPLPQLPAGIRCEVKALVSTDDSNQASFQSRFQGSDWHSQVVSGKKANTNVMVDLGTGISGKENIQFQLNSLNGKPVKFIYFEVYPQAASLITPLLHVPRSWVGKNISIQVDSGAEKGGQWDKLVVEARAFKPQGSGQWLKQIWHELSGGEALFQLQTEYVQIRCTAMPRIGEMPYIRNIRLTVH